jgi:hypothetical protein
MREQTLKAVAALSLLLSLVVVSTRAQSTDVARVTIPFDFQVGGKTFAAGEYLVRCDAQTGVLRILQRDGRASAFFSTSPVQTGTVNENSKLVFNRYKDQYFLSRVWASGSSDGRELGKSRQERALGGEIAKDGLKSQTVAVVVRPR